MSNFSDKVVLITGAGKGIGRALAEAFAAQGARVAANDITPINLDETIEHIQSDGGQAKAYIADIASKLAAQTMLNRIMDDWGRIDILINNARVEPHTPLLALDEWDWRRVIDVNLTGAFLLTQSVGRIMRTQGGGAILNLCKSTESTAQAASNGLIGLTKTAATEFTAYKIRINALVISSHAEADKIINQAFALCTDTSSGQIINL